MTDHINVRALVLDDLMRILEEGAFSNEVLSKSYREHPDLSGADRALYTRLVEGTLEQKIRLDDALDQISAVKVTKMKPLIRTLLRMSAYQILFMDKVPDFAACSEAVKLANKRGFFKLKGFVNGVLRNLSRQKDALQLPDAKKEPVRYLSVLYSVPEWIACLWMDRFGFTQTEEMLHAFMQEKPIVLWTNTRLTTPQMLCKKMEEAGVELQAHPWIQGAFLAKRMEQIAKLEPFRDGWFYIQDTSSLLAISASGIEDGMRVIDVCGAPGGKSLYAYERMHGTGSISCRDLSKRKTAQIKENIKRLHADGINAMEWDATELREEDVEQADLVICDLPCSGLGVIGRKSDIKYRLKPEEITQLAALQKKILTNASRYVKPGGRLLFSTCTITEEENEQNVKWITEHLMLTPVPLEGLAAEVCDQDAAQGYAQFLPHQGMYHDGFFVAAFRKSMS